MKIFVILFLFLLFILFVPIKLKGKVDYSVLNNTGFISVYFYKIKVFLCKISFIPFKILMETKKKKIQIDVMKKEDEYSYGEILFKILMKKIKIDNIRFISKFGLFRDCLVSCVGSGTMLVTMSILMSIISSKKTLENSEITVFPDYTSNRLFLCFSGSIRLNVFVVILSLIISLFKVIKRGIKNYGNKKTC